MGESKDSIFSFYASGWCPVDASPTYLTDEDSFNVEGLGFEMEKPDLESDIRLWVTINFLHWEPSMSLVVHGTLYTSYNHDQISADRITQDALELDLKLKEDQQQKSAFDFCTRCGMARRETWLYCPRCGTKRI